MSRRTQTVKVLFFAGLKEQIGQEEMRVDIKSPASLKALRVALQKALPAHKELLHHGLFRIAINQEIVEEDDSDKTMIQPGDEIAFLPPFAGG